MQKDKLNEEQAQELEYSQDTESEVQANQKQYLGRKARVGGYTYQSYASLELYRGTKGRVAESCGSKDSKKSVIMDYYYPDVSVERMRMRWKDD